MRNLILLLPLLLLPGCNEATLFLDQPIVATPERYDAPIRCDAQDCVYGAGACVYSDLPMAMRTKNYDGGSCVHASTITLLYLHGQDDMARWWRENYSYGEYAGRHNKRLDSAGLRFAYTTSGDVAFLDWACRTRRAAGITFYGNHFVNLLDLTPTTAYLLDNNRTNQVIEIPRDEFIRRWRGYGGWGMTLVYQPPPPKPFLATR